MLTLRTGNDRERRRNPPLEAAQLGDHFLGLCLPIKPTGSTTDLGGHSNSQHHAGSFHPLIRTTGPLPGGLGQAVIPGCSGIMGYLCRAGREQPERSIRHYALTLTPMLASARPLTERTPS